MVLLFFLRCVETVFAIICMNLSLGSLKKSVRFRMCISVIMLLAGCGILTILYNNVGVAFVEKIFIPIIFLVIGAVIIINSTDKLGVIFFNFFTQFLIYYGISMACTMILMTSELEAQWIYLLMRAVAFSLIIFFEVKYIRKPFRYFVKIIDIDWYIYLTLIVAFSFLVVLLSAYPTMYYNRSFYSWMEIVVAYIVLALVLYGMYYTLRNTIEKYELLQSEKSMKEIVKYMEKYKRLSEIDSLTGLLNRSHFQKQVEYNATLWQASALLIMDIDNFKNVNDNFGHNLGDEALKVVSSALKTSFRSTDVIGRLGGDEFMVLMINVQNDNELIKHKIEIFNQNLHKLIADNKVISDLSVSVGVTYINGEADFIEVYKNADIALYKAKKDGKNRTVFYN